MEYSEMKDRIAHIIRAKNLTAADFALRLGIQPSSISHLLSGRNNPSLDFVKKLKETFPEYTLDWIVFGKGPMTTSEPFAPTLDEEPRHHEQPMAKESDPETLLDSVPQETHVATVSSASAPFPSGIILLFDDDTYKILSPR